MHPEIKKFWEDAGYTVCVDILEIDQRRLIWNLMKDGRDLVRWIGESEPQDLSNPHDYDLPCSIYWFHGKKYSEKEMLRIVKLKAFL